MVWAGANLEKFPKFGLYAATRVYESGIASNRKPACYGELIQKFVHTACHLPRVNCASSGLCLM